MAKEIGFHEFVPDFSLTAFPPGTRVVDVGCGAGRHLRELRARGCVAIGVEPDADRVAECRQEGLDVRLGVAEALPLEDRSVDGVVCSVALPYTDERRAIAEWSRVLVPGGEARASYHGLGFPSRQLLLGPGIPARFYGLRTMANTMLYGITGRRLPGWLGDTVYQSRARLLSFYERFGLEVVEEASGKSYLGLPVFYCHRLRKCHPR